MAVYAAVGGVLRDSAIHLARMFSDQVPQETIAQSSFFFCLIYWIILLLLILSSLYFAILDIRFIRLQFTLEKQALIKEGLGTDALLGNPKQIETEATGDGRPKSRPGAAPSDDPGEN